MDFYGDMNSEVLLNSTLEQTNRVDGRPLTARRVNEMNDMMLGDIRLGRIDMARLSEVMSKVTEKHKMITKNGQEVGLTRVNYTDLGIGGGQFNKEYNNRGLNNSMTPVSQSKNLGPTNTQGRGQK
ncbi:MAG: hypothetical protein K5769_01830 [Pseudobutyrivibrio sp.]|nr:hypothetical protein [Pseudobutyrivibrio sp.]